MVDALLRELLRRVGDWRIAFLRPVVTLLTTLGRLFFGPSLAFKLFLSLDEFILALFGHLSSSRHAA
jgi:hypothetical protein